MITLAWTGCAGDRSASANSDASSGLAPLEPASSPRNLLAALRADHRTVRRRIGPHRLRYTLRVSFTPTAKPGLVPVGPGAPRAQDIEDGLELVWAATDPVTFSIEQHNDHDRGQALIVIGDRVYRRLHPRPWYEGELETDAHELWLDEAVRAAADAIELVAPWLQVEGSEDGDRLTFVLAQADSEDGTLRPTRESAAWRSGAHMTAVNGTLAVDRATQTWLSLELSAAFSLDTPGPPVGGKLSFSGSLERLDPAQAAVSPPPDASPSPQRKRYEPERRALLDGLAAP